MNLLTLANKLAEELGEDRVAEVTVEEARLLLDGDEVDAITDALDQAQGDARQSNTEQFVLIRVRP